MSSRFWPKDVLGNDIRKENLISLSPGQPVIMKVVEVVEAGVITPHEGYWTNPGAIQPQCLHSSPPCEKCLEVGVVQGPMIKQGWINCVVQLPYQPHHPQIPIAVVVKEPEEAQSRIHRV